MIAIDDPERRSVTVNSNKDLLDSFNCRWHRPSDNDARVSSQTFDDDESNNLDTVVTEVAGLADVPIAKSDSPDPVVPVASFSRLAGWLR